MSGRKDVVVAVFGTNPNNDAGGKECGWIKEEEERARRAVGLRALATMFFAVGGEKFKKDGEIITEAESMRRRIMTYGDGGEGLSPEISLAEEGLETITQSLDFVKRVGEANLIDPLIVVVSCWHQCPRASMVIRSEGYHTKTVIANPPRIDKKTARDLFVNFIAGGSYTFAWIVMHKLGMWHENSPFLRRYQNERQMRNDKHDGKI